MFGARTQGTAIRKVAVIIVALSFLTFLPPVQAQHGRATETVTNFSNGKLAVEVNLAKDISNSTIGIPVYKKSTIDTAELSVRSEGITVRKELTVNTTTLFQKFLSASDRTEISDNTVHLKQVPTNLLIPDAAGFKDGESMGVVADTTVHLANGDLTWEQFAFYSGPGYEVSNDNSSGFSTGTGVDWSRGDGALRLDYGYKMISKQPTGNIPSVRGGMAVATNPNNDMMFIMGGTTNNSKVFRDTHALTLDTAHWSNICDPCNIMNSDKANATMVYQPSNNVIVLAGGDDGYMNVDDSTFTLSSPSCMSMWSKNPSLELLPSGLTGHSEVYDEATGRAMIFGGRNTAGIETSSFFTSSGVSTWTDNTGSISQKPSPRYGHSAVFDQASGTMYVFGGQTDSSYMNDLYTFKVGDTFFSQLYPSGPAPEPRSYHSAMWDTTVGAMIVAGGRSATAIFSDIWVYWPSNNTWTYEGTLPNGAGRSGMASAWSQNLKVAYLWGGFKDLQAMPNDNSVISLSGRYVASGYIESSVIGYGTATEWNGMSINAEGISGATTYGSLIVEVRTGNTMTPDGSWSGWVLVPDPYDLSSIPPSYFIHYRLTITSDNGQGTPVVHSLVIFSTITASSGYLTTRVFDLKGPPLAFTGFSANLIDIPMVTRTVITLEGHDQASDPWATILLDDNSTLRKQITYQFIRFNITMSSTMPGISPYLLSLELDYLTIAQNGTYVLTYQHDGKQIESFAMKWDVANFGQNAGKWTVDAEAEINGSWLPIKNAAEMRIDPNAKIFEPLPIRFKFQTDGKADPNLLMVQITSQTVSLPTELSIDIGNDGIAELRVQGLFHKGEVQSVPDLGPAIQKHLGSSKLQVDETGRIIVPISILSKADSIVTLQRLNVVERFPNYPPTFLSSPMIKAELKKEYRYEVQVIDKDSQNLTLTLVNGPTGMFLSGKTVFWVPTAGQETGDVSLSVSDGIDTTYQNYAVTVNSSNPGHPPAIVSTPPIPFYNPADNTVRLRYGDTFHYVLDVIDPVSMATVTVNIEQGPKGMTLDNMARIIDWTPSVSSLGTFPVVIRAFDGSSAGYQSFKIIVEPNTAPKFDQPIPALKVVAGKSLSHAVKASDTDQGDKLKYSVQGPTWLTIDSVTGLLTAKPGQKETGTYTFKVTISDGHLNATQDATIKVSPATVVGGLAKDDLLGLLLIILVVVIVVIVVVVLVVMSKKQKKAKLDKALQAAPSQPAPPPVAAPRPQPAPLQAHTPPQPRPQPVQAQVHAPQPQPAPAPVAKDAGAEEKPIIEEIYLIYNDGRLIAHESAKGALSMDEHVLSGMLKAIQEFVKDSFQKEGALGGLDYGDFRIMLESGNCATFAIVLKGTETKALREETKRALERIEGLYAGVIECWDGDTAHFGDVKKYFGPLFALGKTQEEQAEAGEVKIMSGLEFFQGYVRLKTAVKNSFPFMVYDVNLKIIYDKKALQLDHIEPEYEREGSEVVLGNIPPNEKKTVAFYLDPLICMESSIDATAIFKNYKGELKTVLMKRKPVDIVCPIFYTEQNVNVAMLKRLVTELKYHDSKIYAIPKALPPSEATRLAKTVVEARDVKFVREFVEENPYIAEAWFYGKTKHSLEDLVIRATVREDKGLLEVFVASNNLATLPGLLADLGHGLKKKYADIKKTKEGLTQVTDANIKDELEKSRLLIDKYVSSEAPASTDETEL